LPQSGVIKSQLVEVDTNVGLYKGIITYQGICPDGSMSNVNTGMCTVQKCPEGQIRNDKGVCVAPKECKAFEKLTGKMYLRVNPITHALPRGTACIDGCAAFAVGDAPTRIDDKGNVYGTFHFEGLGEKCTGNLAPEEYPSMGSGGDSGDDIPTGFPGTGGDKPGGGDSPGGGGDPGGDGSDPGGGGDPGGGTNPGGGVGGDGKDDKPGRAALGSCQSYQCSGDAIDCEIMRGIWKQYCQTEWMDRPNEFSDAIANAASQPDQPIVTEKDIGGVFTERSYISERSSCPGDFSVGFMGRTISVPMGWFCEYLGVIRAIFQAMAWLYVIRLLLQGL
jgi:hypothetical protein